MLAKRKLPAEQWHHRFISNNDPLGSEFIPQRSHQCLFEEHYAALLKVSFVPYRIFFNPENSPMALRYEYQINYVMVPEIIF